jgi:hypothetical protein
VRVALPADVEADIEDLVASCHHDPLQFVRIAYPWGEPGGPLADEPGPDANQVEFLTALGTEIRARAFNGRDPVMPILMNESSGHGTGKSAMGAWLADFLLSTRPHSIGTVTAGTATQLSERTWAAIQYWTRLCLTAPWFDIMERGIYSKAFPDTWKLVAQTCKAENAQAFAGQHARTSTSWYLFDEASQVPDKIWETAYGGLTDGEPMFFAWGQPVRNTGEFYRVCFGSRAARWNGRRVDSRTSRFTNKDLLAQQITDYGIDSDFVKVRVLGLPPSASELQYIDKARVDLARARTLTALPDEPARVAKCAELLSDRRPGHQLAALFVDAAFGAAIVVRLRALGHTNVHEINFGGASPDPHEKNMRAFMYRKGKEWLLLGSLPDDDRLCDQLGLAGYHLDTSGKLVIESKADIQARGEASPDDSDAFLLTFAQAVALPRPAAAPYRPTRTWG